MKNGWVIVTIWAAALAIALFAVGVLDLRVVQDRTVPNPAADGVITRAELQGVVDRANAIHAKMRLEPHAEYCHKRVDRLIEGVEAMAPGLKNRARVNELVNEARRTK